MNSTPFDTPDAIAYPEASDYLKTLTKLPPKVAYVIAEFPYCSAHAFVSGEKSTQWSPLYPRVCGILAENLPIISEDAAKNFPFRLFYLYSGYFAELEVLACIGWIHVNARNEEASNYESNAINECIDLYIKQQISNKLFWGSSADYASCQQGHMMTKHVYDMLCSNGQEIPALLAESLKIYEAIESSNALPSYFDPKRRSYFEGKMSDYSHELRQEIISRAVANTDEYFGLLNELKINGMKDLVAAIRKSSFTTAKSGHHHIYPSGTLEHSLGVYHKMINDTTVDFSYEEKTLVALLHDVCMGHNPDWDNLPGTHGLKSRNIVEKYIPNARKDYGEVLIAIEYHRKRVDKAFKDAHPLLEFIKKYDHEDAAECNGGALALDRFKHLK